MKSWRFQLAFFLGGALAATALALSVSQLELDVRSAFNHLLDAGNYSWDESRAVFFDPLQRNAHTLPTGTGETVIDGYTTATFRRRQVVLLGPQAVLKMNNGWRHANDLTDDEVAELGRLQLSPRLGTAALPNPVEQPPVDPRAAKRAAERAHRYTHAMPHEVLRYLLQHATRWRMQGALFAADAADTYDELRELETYVMTGKFSPRLEPIAPWGGLLGTPKRPPSRPLPPEETAILFVTITGGQIEEFSVEFTRSSNISFDGKPAEKLTTTTVYRMKLLKIGSTTVTVDPEVKALFLDVPPSP